jgi:hypothetical protein
MRSHPLLVDNIHVMNRQAASGAICAFVEMATPEQARSVIEALNGRVTLPSGLVLLF